MSVTRQKSHEAEQAVRQATDNHSIRLLGRVGLVAYGVVHLLLAYLAARVAMGAGGGDAKTDKSGALQTLAGQPGGRLMLWLVTVGLAALVLWQLAEAVWGHRRHQGARRTRKRIVSAGEAVVFGLLGYAAGRMAAGDPRSPDAESSFTARVLALPFGQALVAAAGLGLVAIAAFLVYHGVKKRFTDDLDFTGASATARKTAIRLGEVGFPALGVAYGTVGVLIVVAAVTFDPKKASGFDVALKTLAAQPYGMVLLGVLAAGLACFGVYCLFDARFRRG